MNIYLIVCIIIVLIVLILGLYFGGVFNKKMPSVLTFTTKKWSVSKSTSKDAFSATFVQKSFTSSSTDQTKQGDGTYIIDCMLSDTTTNTSEVVTYNITAVGAVFVAVDPDNTQWTINITQDLSSPNGKMKMTWTDKASNTIVFTEV